MTVPSLDGAPLEITQSTTSGEPMVAALAGGGFAVFYRTSNLDGDAGTTAALRLYDAEGVPAGPSFAVDADPAGVHLPHALVTTPTGFAAVWLESPDAGGAQTTFLQRFDEDGTRDGDPVELPNGAFGSVVGLSAAPDGALIAIHANFTDDTTRVSVVEPDGTLSKSFVDEGMGRNSIVGGPWQSATAANGEILFLRNTVGARLPDMSWSRDLTLHRLDADGAPIGSTVIVDDLAQPGTFLFAALTGGGAAVVEIKSGTDSEAVVRLVSEAGVVSDPISTPLDGYVEGRSLVPTDDGGFLVLFVGGEFSGPAGMEVLAQKFDAAGAAEGELFAVNQDPDGNQGRSEGVAPADGDLIVVYESGPDFEILGQFLDPTGTSTGIELDDPVIENFGKGKDREHGGNNDDVMRGGAGADRLWGHEGDDRLYGGGAKDRLYGGEDDDRLFGGGGADRLYGGEGDDRLDGGKGRDRYEGGEGSDIFVIGRKSKVMIEDFDPGIDRIEVTSGASAFDDLAFKERKGDVLVKIKGATVARLEDVDDASVLDHFDFLFS